MRTFVSRTTKGRLSRDAAQHLVDRNHTQTTAVVAAIARLGRSCSACVVAVRFGSLIFAPRRVLRLSRCFCRRAHTPRPRTAPLHSVA